MSTPTSSPRGNAKPSSSSRSFEELLEELRKEHHRQLQDGATKPPHVFMIHDGDAPCAREPLAQSETSYTRPSNWTTDSEKKHDSGTLFALEPVEHSIKPAVRDVRESEITTRSEKPSVRESRDSNITTSSELAVDSVSTAVVRSQTPDLMRTSKSYMSKAGLEWLQGSFHMSPSEQRMSNMMGTNLDETLSLVHGVKTIDQTLLVRTQQSRTMSGWRGPLQTLSQTSYFELLMCFIVVANTMFIGVEVNYMAERPLEEPSAAFSIVGHLFAAVFLVELIIAWLGNGRDFVCGTGTLVYWNYLDIIIVASSIVEIIIELVSLTTGSADDGVGDLSKARIVRILRIARIMRLFRVARLVRFFKALQLIILGILHTLRSVFWSMFLLLIIIYIISIVLTLVVTDYILAVHSQPEDMDVDSEIYDALIHRWGTLPDAILSLFMSISGGIDWDLLVRPLEMVGSLWMFVFVAFIMFTQFAVLNVVTGIFCQNAMEMVDSDQEKMISTFRLNRKLFTKRFAELFHIIDEGQTGYITQENFVDHVDDENVMMYFATLELEAADALSLFRILDHDPKEGVAIEDFVLGCIRLKGGAKSCDIVQLLHDSKELHKSFTEFKDWVETSYSNLLTEGIKTKFSDRGLISKRGEHVAPELAI